MAFQEEFKIRNDETLVEFVSLSEWRHFERNQSLILISVKVKDIVKWRVYYKQVGRCDRIKYIYRLGLTTLGRVFNYDMNTSVGMVETLNNV